MLLSDMEPRIFDIDFQLIHDAVLSIISIFFLFPIFAIFILGSAVIIKLLIKKLREK